MSDVYTSPFGARYASKEMLALFSPNARYRLFRRLWVALAEAEAELGLPISEEQLQELRAFQNDINYEVIEQKEREIRHDVMAHIYGYGVQCPTAKGIIHLGATSCYVTDNADIILLREGLALLEQKLLALLKLYADFILEYKDLPTLGYTHYQPAQPTTVGKRASLWAQDFYQDLLDLRYVKNGMRLLGNKGTTGTQASFMELFMGDSAKVDKLEELIAQKLGFSSCYPVAGQTYPRKEDARVCNVLAGLAQSAYRFGADLRLLQHEREVEEPFENKQVGSSAMAYKRNPMRSERICSLARFVMVNAQNPLQTAAAQWLERTLDDSANKRIAVAECFLASDSILELCLNVVAGLVVNKKVIDRHLREHLPFIATENILMAAVKRGGDRQALHEKIREHSMAAAARWKEEGENDLLPRIAEDASFGLAEGELAALLNPELYTGRAGEQAENFVRGELAPLLENAPTMETKNNLSV